MSSIVEQIIKEHKENKINAEILADLQVMFEFKGDKLDLINHMKKWKGAQPITDMTVLEKLDNALEMMRDSISQSESMEDEIGNVQSAIDELNYYTPSDEMREARDTVEDVISSIKEPKDQAEADMEE